MNDESPAQPVPCEHYWASRHEPGHRLYWVRQCMLCPAIDWDDLDHQIDALTAAAAGPGTTGGGT